MTTITFRIYSSHLADMDVTREQCATYADRLRAAITTRYPDAMVDVEVLHNVSGVGAGPRVESDDGSEDAVEFDVRELSDRVLSDIVNA